MCYLNLQSKAVFSICEIYVIVASSYIGGLPAIHCRNALVKGVFWKNKQTKDQTACNSFLRAQLTECLVLIRVVSWIFQSPHRDHPGHTCFFMDGFRVRYCLLLQQGKNKERTRKPAVCQLGNWDCSQLQYFLLVIAR